MPLKTPKKKLEMTKEVFFRSIKLNYLNILPKKSFRVVKGAHVRHPNTLKLFWAKFFINIF